MANIKSQKKRIKTNEKARIRNVAYKSKLRTAIKAVRVACANKDLENAKVLYVKATSIIDRSVTKGITTKKAAARQKSNLQLLINKVSA